MTKHSTICLVLLKAQVSLQLGKVFSSDNGVSVSVMCSCMDLLIKQHTAKRTLSDKLLFNNMYECFMNTKYLCACLKRYHANLSLKQGYNLPSSIQFDNHIHVTVSSISMLSEILEIPLHVINLPQCESTTAKQSLKFCHRL